MEEIDMTRTFELRGGGRGPLLLLAAIVALALLAAWAVLGTAAAQPTGIVTQIDAGEDHTCVVTEARTAICWGRNDDGQSNAAESTLTYVSAGAKHSCGLTSGNRVVCWGSDSYGQQMQDFLPSSSATLHQVSAGSRNTCVHYAVSFAWCEGDASHLTIGSYFGLGGNSAPQAVGVGAKHACWLTGGHLTCKGDNVYGQIDIPSGSGYRGLSVGANHNCVRDENGAVQCWGRNRHAQTAVPTSVKFLDIAAGTSHTCGVRDSNELQCWGLNDSGQTNAVAGDTWSLVAAGGSHSCAVNESGKVACWGDNSHGQLNVPATIAASGVRAGTAPAGAAAVSVTGDTMTAYFPAGRIVARRLGDGRTEFGYHPQGGQRILPDSRYFPTDATVGTWLNSGSVIVDGEEVGRINARLLADGRIEFAFTPSGDERILPGSRYFSASSSGGWLQSSLIGFN